MGTSVERSIAQGHLLLDSIHRTRTALDAFIATLAEAELLPRGRRSPLGWLARSPSHV
jgi:hypothetical protein